MAKNNRGNVEKIIKKIMEGDIDAFAEIIRMYQKDVWKVVAAMLRSRELTEELVQETFINAYTHLDQFETDKEFSPWLKAIARNVVREKLRKRSKQSERFSVYFTHLQTQIENEEKYAEHRSRLAEALLKCREKLSPFSRELLDMRYKHTVSFEKIALHIDRTLKATRQLLSRIRIKLKNCIERQLADHETG
jgi:RNA polymerase sigma-70 factor (ECF subfamily)